MLYNEDFKKQVVKKVMTPGVVQNDIAQKLHINNSSIRNWRLKYAEEVRSEIVQINVEALLAEEKVDIDQLLMNAEPAESQAELEAINRIPKEQDPSHYTNPEKYAMIMHLKKLPKDRSGAFLRNYGLQTGHIRQWEDEILAMGKKKLDANEIIRKQEEEIKLLKKQLKNAERDKRELEILVELKKKYKHLFGEDGED